MTIIVKFFASLREQVGQSEVQIELMAPKTVGEIWAQVCDNAPLPNHILMAVNKAYSNIDTQVQDGDEIAFFPPVTGG